MAWVEALLLALIKHFVFVSCRECFVNTWIHYQVLWNQRTFISIIYLFRIIPAIVKLLLHYDGDLVTRTDCGPEYAACATQHRDHGYMLDTCYGYMSQRCNGAGHLIPVKCQLCFSWNQFHTQTTRLSRDMSPHIAIMFMLFECGFARINRRPIRRYNLPGRPGVPKLPDTEVERCILSDLRQL